MARSVADPRQNRQAVIKLAEASAKAKAEARIGTVVSGRYRLTEVIAMGGVGVVYKAEHVHMHKWVAIKLLHPDAQDAPDLVARFRREAVVGAHVQHPNVIAATDFGELDDGSFFLVLEFVRGVTLREVIQRGPMSSGRAVQIVKQLASALGAVHGIGIVHRDVTPRNIMLIEGERDAVKLIDFGLAKLDPERFAAEALSPHREKESRITGTGAVFGTIAYLAPEVATGMDLVDARADLYALGIVMYELLSGKHPFDTTDAVQLFKRHATVKPPPIAERTPGVVVPPAVEAVAMRLLAKAPEARYPNADALIAALDASVEGAPLTSTPPPAAAREQDLAFAGPSFPPPPVLSSAPPPPPVAPLTVLTPAPRLPFASVMEPERERWPYIVAAVALLAAITVGVLWWSRLRADPSPPPAGSATAPLPSVEAPFTTGSPGGAPEAATPAPSAAPKAAQKPVTPPGPPDPVTRAQLRAAVAAHDFIRATTPFFTLVEHDSTAFHEPLMALCTRDLAVAISAVPGEEADKVFDALASRLGSDGVDILYEIIRTRGGSKAAARAEEKLLKPEVLAQATPALQVTWALRQAACPDKPALLDRAAKEGDVRTLREMEVAGKTCSPRSQALLDAMKSLKQRLSQRPEP